MTDWYMFRLQLKMRLFGHCQWRTMEPCIVAYRVPWTNAVWRRCTRRSCNSADICKCLDIRIPYLLNNGYVVIHFSLLSLLCRSYTPAQTLAGGGSGMSTSRTGSQLEWAVFCSLCGPSKLATILSSLNAHTAEPRRLFLYSKDFDSTVNKW